MTAIRRYIAVMLLSVAGCGDADGSTPSVFPTEHLEVDPSDSDVICRGLLDDMEAQAVRVAEWLELGFPFPIPVEYGSSAVDEHCSYSHLMLGGCVLGLGDDIVVAADYATVYHELVHAVRAANGLRGPWFFEEGIAKALEGFRPHAFSIELNPETVQRGPAFLVGLPRAEIQLSDYAIAGAFTQWLIDTYGRDAVAAFLNDKAFIEDAGVAFAEHFGLTLQEAEDAWRKAAEDYYEFGGACYPERALDWSGSALTLAGRVDCAAPNTSGPFPSGNISTLGHCFTLEEPAVLRVEFDAPVGEVTIDRAEVLCSGPNVDLTPEHYQPKKIQAGEALDLPFAACYWEILVKSPLDQPIDFTLRLTRP